MSRPDAKAPDTRSTKAPRFTALPWTIWLAVATIVVLSTNNALVLAAVAVGCWVSMIALGGPRAAVSRPVAGASFVLAALWALLGVGIHRDSLGGQVVWVLPDWSLESSGEFGGAVTVGQLHFAAARGWQSLAIVAMVGLLFQVVSAGGWLRLADVVCGRATAAFAPVLCLGDAWAERQQEAALTRRAGFGGSGGSALADVADRARALAEAWDGRTRRRPSVVAAVAGLALALAATLWWAITATDMEPRWTLSGIERTLIVVGCLAVVGLTLRARQLPRPRVDDLVPLVAAAALALAWFGREHTGDADALVVDFAQMPPAPLVLLAAVAVLPVLSVAAGARR